MFCWILLHYYFPVLNTLIWCVYILLNYSFRGLHLKQSLVRLKQNLGICVNFASKMKGRVHI